MRERVFLCSVTEKEEVGGQCQGEWEGENERKPQTLEECLLKCKYDRSEIEKDFSEDDDDC